MGAWRVTETLSRTGGFGVNIAQRRLLETLQHFIEVIEDLDSIKPGGKGFVSSVRVRLLHASVRRRLMQLEREKPGYFDVDKWGVPINDLHCIGTVSVYSTAIIYMALPRQGIYLSEQQITDYLALWRWTGYLLGAPVGWMTTPAKAKAMMESVMTMEMGPSQNSRILANNILTAEARVPPLYAPRELLVAQAYQLNGTVLASALGIETPRWYYRVFVWIQCLVLIFLSYTYPCMPAVAQRDIDRRFRNIVHHMITDKSVGGIGKPSKFNFQYIPRLGMMTELGTRDDLATAEKSAPKRSAKAVLVVGLMVGVVYLVGVTNLLRAVPHSLLSSMVAEPQVLQSLG
ncbi:hypothetical protein B0T10DRAFT_491856 [Thelonectria olida]|uniref:ER-bound oxygenase mpaB/mpaB'/Rubber oxygenase catalytic domain-containing protein n=1 Tax=Thelonectria olida TaxID=1576542 RepID=A0A9P8W0S5_9HYPO|nr:hypothetical protein B0T10DRAFT_491856 [Thelonectria olida]